MVLIASVIVVTGINLWFKAMTKRLENALTRRRSHPQYQLSSVEEVRKVSVHFVTKVSTL